MMYNYCVIFQSEKFSHWGCVCVPRVTTFDDYDKLITFIFETVKIKNPSLKKEDMEVLSISCL